MAEENKSNVKGAITTQDAPVTPVGNTPVNDAVTGVPTDVKRADLVEDFDGDGTTENRPEHLNVPKEAIEHEKKKAEKAEEVGTPFTAGPEQPVDYK